MPEPIKRVCLLGGESTGKTTLARALAAVYDTVWNPEFGRAVHRDRARPGRTVDERRVHAHRADPVLVRGLACGVGARRAVLRHGRVHDEALPSGLSRRAHACLRRPRQRGTTTCSSSAAWTFPGDTTGSGSSTISANGCTQRYLERAQASGSPWVLLEGLTREPPAPRAGSPSIASSGDERAGRRRRALDGARGGGTSARRSTLDGTAPDRRPRGDRRCAPRVPARRRTGSDDVELPGERSGLRQSGT